MIKDFSVKLKKAKTQEAENNHLIEDAIVNLARNVKISTRKILKDRLEIFYKEIENIEIKNIGISYRFKITLIAYWAVKTVERYDMNISKDFNVLIKKFGGGIQDLFSNLTQKEVSKEIRIEFNIFKRYRNGYLFFICFLQEKP